ncbi:MAG: biotin/lipoate A/B protein ligase family protein [Candidatus Bathyarchaeota archaeon]|jgi:lipoate-protein ligase A
MEGKSVIPHATWRLLDTGISDGATNMAIDEAIMKAVAEGRSPPTLRFYGWSPPCVSIGYAQSLQDEIDLDLCREKGYSWVRRPTGGRAILHIDELTYSVVAPRGEVRVAGDIITSYRKLSTGLVEGLRSLTSKVFQADRIFPDGEIEKSAACFDVPSHYEVTALGRKLVGSAQVRRRGVVLQHGALPLKGDVSRLVEVLALSEPEREALRVKLLQRAIALDEAVGREITYDEATKAISLGFSQALNLKLEPASLSPHERELANQLIPQYAGGE